MNLHKGLWFAAIAFLFQGCFSAKTQSDSSALKQVSLPVKIHIESLDDQEYRHFKESFYFGFYNCYRVELRWVKKVGDHFEIDSYHQMLGKGFNTSIHKVNLLRLLLSEDKFDWYPDSVVYNSDSLHQAMDLLKNYQEKDIYAIEWSGNCTDQTVFVYDNLYEKKRRIFEISGSDRYLDSWFEALFRIKNTE